MPSKRDDFPASVLKLISAEVGHVCSNPGCGAPTSGPSASRGASNIGTAAHITAAARLGPRYDGALTPQERKSAANAIWLCARCSRHIDNDVDTYTSSELHDWKTQAIARARRALETGKPIKVGPSKRARTHDTELFKLADGQMSEAQLLNLIYDLDDDAFHEKRIAPLDAWVAFFEHEGNQFINPSIRQRSCDVTVSVMTFLKFTGLKFFPYPRSSQSYALHPALNADREGSGAADESRKYDALQKELQQLVDSMRSSYRLYRRTIKEQLAL